MKSLLHLFAAACILALPLMPVRAALIDNPDPVESMSEGAPGSSPCDNDTENTAPRDQVSSSWSCYQKNH